MKGESTFIHVRNKTMISLIVIAAVVLFILIMFFSFVPIGLWISAMAAGVHVGIFSLVGMRLRRVVPSRIILPLVKATKAGLKLSVNQLEAHYLVTLMELLMHLLHQKEQELICHLKKQQQLILQVVMS